MLKHLSLRPKQSSRSQIAIKEVRDNVLAMPHNNYAAVIETSSINFELKSESEQDLIIERFSHFLNALPGSIQILVRVREIAIEDYIGLIQGKTQHESNPLYRDQIESYSNFVRSLVAGNKIMSRKFYIIVPHRSSSSQISVINEQLSIHCDIVVKGLEKMNMKAIRLNSIEVLELFYELYNPGRSKIQKLHLMTNERLIKNIYAI